MHCKKNTFNTNQRKSNLRDLRYTLDNLLFELFDLKHNFNHASFDYPKGKHDLY